MRLRAAVVAATLSLLVPLRVPDACAATLVVDVMDGAGEGFNDPSPRAPVGGNPGTTLGAQRLNAFQFAANIWAGMLSSSVTIRISATFDPLTCSMTSAVLGQAGPVTFARDFAGAPAAGTWYPIALANARAGTDLDPGNDDIVAQFNSTFGNGCAFPGGFYYGYDSSPPGINDSDFVSVILHELCHGLGFLTLVNLSTGVKASGFDDTFMLDLEDHSTTKLWPMMTNGERVTSSIDTGDLHWVGTSVVLAGVTLTAGRDLVSGHVRMFAPNPQQPGSSVSHFDTVLTPNQLMEPTYTGPNHDPGLGAHVMEDIGWTVSFVPTTTTTSTSVTSTTSTTSTSTSSTLPALDHYMCDKVSINTSAGGTKFDKLNLPTRSLDDALGPPETCPFVKEKFICAPAEKNGEGPPAHPAIHLVNFALKCPTPFTKIVGVAVYDQFNPGGVLIDIQKKFSVMVPSGKINLGPVPPAPPQTVPPAPPALTVDHFLCYKIAGPSYKLAPIGVTVTDQFYPGGYPSLALYKMTKLCAPVNKNGEDPSAPSHVGFLTCYQAKLPKGTPFTKTFVSTNNTNFGANVLKVANTGELCMPAIKP